MLGGMLGGMDPFGMMGGMFGGPNGLPGGGSDKGALGDHGISFKPQNLPGGGIIFSDPNEMFMKQQLHAGSQAYGQMRPEMAQAQMNAMRGTLQTMDPYNRAMAMMYGPGFQQLPQVQNPMSERMMRIGNPTLPTDMPQQQPGQQPERAAWLGGGGFMGTGIGGGPGETMTDLFGVNGPRAGASALGDIGESVGRGFGPAFRPERDRGLRERE